MGIARNGTLPAARDPLTALEQIDKMDATRRLCFCLKTFTISGRTPRCAGNCAAWRQKMKFTKKSIVIITPSSRIPDELKNEVVLETCPAAGCR